MTEDSRPDHSPAVGKTNPQQPETAELWADLTQLIKGVVEELNRVDELRAKAGELSYQMQNTEQIIVSNQSEPAMSVIVTSRSTSIDVHTRIVVTGAVPLEQEGRENLTVYIDESGPSFRNENGVALTLEQAVFYILRPFLHLGEPN
jgi:hypothetical protein